MSDENLYLRWKSQVTGPFSSSDIKAMLEEGRITKHHQVSVDRVVWNPLRESDLFRTDCRLAPSASVTASVPNATYTSPSMPSATRAGSASDGGEHRAQLRFKPADDGHGDERWYYVYKGESVGPVTAEELLQLSATGRLGKKSPVCREGEQKWVKAGDAFPLFWRDTPTPAIPAWDGRETAPVAGGGYAGFWLRFCAAFIDGLLLAVLDFVAGAGVGFVVGLTMGASGADLPSIGSTAAILAYVAAGIVNWVYYASAESSSARATPGKRAMGLFVTDLNGERVSFGQATGRYLGKILSALFLGIGYLMAGFTEKKQALHDMMAGTLVLRR